VLRSSLAHLATVPFAILFAASASLLASTVGSPMAWFASPAAAVAMFAPAAAAGVAQAHILFPAADAAGRIGAWAVLLAAAQAAGLGSGYLCAAWVIGGVAGGWGTGAAVGGFVDFFFCVLHLID
jgi:hypothetical protein